MNLSQRYKPHGDFLSYNTLYSAHCERCYQPEVHHLLSGLIECGQCGSAYSSYRRYFKRKLVTGALRIEHKAAYKCIWRFRQADHVPALGERCRNPEIATLSSRARSSR
jgi:recombinase-like zinc beta ribbon protein